MIGKTRIISPGSPIGNSDYLKRKMRKKCRSRAAIEPVIGHIKSDCRMERNYLKGTVGDEINAIMTAAALNFRRLLRIIEQDIILTLIRWRVMLAYKQNPVPIKN
jgi:IS5 family transposase